MKEPQSKECPTSCLTAEEVARILRANPKTIYAAAKAGEIPSLRLGRKVLFSREALTAWLRGETK